MKNDLQHYPALLNTIKARIRQAQTRAVSAANREMLGLYWDIGRIIIQQQDGLAGFGAFADTAMKPGIQAGESRRHRLDTFFGNVLHRLDQIGAESQAVLAAAQHDGDFAMALDQSAP